jgi:glycosyltransferase involved in cell wall biosynthesis
MARLAEDPALRRRMGAHARERVRERFGAARLLADIDGLYTELLEARGYGDRIRRFSVGDRIRA